MKRNSIVGRTQKTKRRKGKKRKNLRILEIEEKKVRRRGG